MATAALPQLYNSTLTAQQLNMLNAVAASSPPSGTTSSPFCSTPVTMINPIYHSYVPYIQAPNHNGQLPSVYPPILPSITSAFEGVPIFLVPQSFSSSSPGTISFPALQKAVVSCYKTFQRKPAKQVKH